MPDADEKAKADKLAAAKNAAKKRVSVLPSIHSSTEPRS